MKASARSNGSMLWKEEPQEGIDGRDLRISVTARTRRETKALKPASRAGPPSGGQAKAGNGRREWAPRGAPIAIEEKPLKGEAHGRSGAQAPGGPVVDVARGVAKPRTRYAAAEGSAVEDGSAGLRSCRRVVKVQERKRRLTCRATGGTARGPGDELWRGAEVHGGPPSGLGPRDSASVEDPQGGRNAGRDGWNP